MAAKSYTKEQLKQQLEKLKYNMLDCDKIAAKLSDNASEEYKELKKVSHKALADGRDAMLSDDLKKANSNFAFAYQTRCCCDWIWKNVLGKSGDSGHANYLIVTREFSKLAAEKQKLSEAGKKKLSEDEKKRILTYITAIHD